MRDRTADLLRARQALSQLSYSPIFVSSRYWWVWVDSNHRPPAYQASALTSWATDPISSLLLSKPNQSVWTLIVVSSYKEVIQPQVPLGLPCYDFTPVMNHKVVSVLPERLNYPLLLQPTPMVWRAVCTRPGNVFTVTFWFTITSDSDFMESSCRLQSGLRRTFGIAHYR